MRDRCPFCNDDRVIESIKASERMFGLEGTFIYRQCANCGSLYLDDPTLNLAPFYPDTYYSYAGTERPKLAGLFEDLNSRVKAKTFVSFLRRSGVNVDASTRFIDVGSGSGDLLRALRALGLSHVMGIDPYLRAGVETNGIPVMRGSIESVAEGDDRPQSDVVMFHHSLEHVVDPEGSLRAAAQLLAPGGAILVRIPIVSYAWERFGVNWVGLDAPRHLAIPTQRGFEQLAMRLGLRIAACRYDSTSTQFVASEAIERGLTLTNAFPSNPPRTAMRAVLSIPKSLHAKRLNAQRRGDQAAFTLVRSTDVA